MCSRPQTAWTPSPPHARLPTCVCASVGLRGGTRRRSRQREREGGSDGGRANPTVIEGGTEETMLPMAAQMHRCALGVQGAPCDPPKVMTPF